MKTKEIVGFKLVDNVVRIEHLNRNGEVVLGYSIPYVSFSFEIFKQIKDGSYSYDVNMPFNIDNIFNSDKYQIYNSPENVEKLKYFIHSQNYNFQDSGFIYNDNLSTKQNFLRVPEYENCINYNINYYPLLLGCKKVKVSQQEQFIVCFKSLFKENTSLSISHIDNVFSSLLSKGNNSVKEFLKFFQDELTFILKPRIRKLVKKFVHNVKYGKPLHNVLNSFETENLLNYSFKIDNRIFNFRSNIFRSRFLRYRQDKTMTSFKDKIYRIFDYTVFKLICSEINSQTGIDTTVYKKSYKRVKTDSNHYDYTYTNYDFKELIDKILIKLKSRFKK